VVKDRRIIVDSGAADTHKGTYYKRAHRLPGSAENDLTKRKRKTEKQTRTEIFVEEREREREREKKRREREKEGKRREERKRKRLVYICTYRYIEDEINDIFT